MNKGCITFPQNKTRNRYDPVISPALCDSTLYIHWKKITMYYMTNTQHRKRQFHFLFHHSHTSSLPLLVLCGSDTRRGWEHFNQMILVVVVNAQSWCYGWRDSSAD